MEHEEWLKLNRKLINTPISKKINKNCVFANTVDDCKCGALSNYYCDGCNFYKSKDEYYLDDGGFCHRKEV